MPESVRAQDFFLTSHQKLAAERASRLASRSSHDQNTIDGCQQDRVRKAAATTLRCVIVDDRPELLRGAIRTLEGQGVSVVGVAQNCEQARLLIAELQPDVALVDIVLGPESGFDLVRVIANAADSPRSHSILMSTRDEADLVDLIAASPAIGFLGKADLSARAIQRLLDQTRER